MIINLFHINELDCVDGKKKGLIGFLKLNPARGRLSERTLWCERVCIFVFTFQTSKRITITILDNRTLLWKFFINWPTQPVMQLWHNLTFQKPHLKFDHLHMRYKTEALHNLTRRCSFISSYNFHWFLQNVASYGVIFSQVRLCWRSAVFIAFSYVSITDAHTSLEHTNHPLCIFLWAELKHRTMLHYETLLLNKMEYPSVIRLMCCFLLFSSLFSVSSKTSLLCK